MYICSNCWKQKCNCNKSNYIEIDEGMVDIICKLNKKGYQTLNCCEGHINSCGICTYIQFKTVYDFKNIPNGFEYDIQEVDGNLLCGINRFVSIDCDKVNGYFAEVDNKLLNEEQLEFDRLFHLTILNEWICDLTNLKNDHK